MPTSKVSPFSALTFLSKVGGGQSVKTYRPKQIIFSQGEIASAVFYLREGTVKITVGSDQGREVVLAMLAAGDLVGEACLGGQTHRAATAAAVTDCEIVRLDKAAVLRAIQHDPDSAEMFIGHLLARAVRLEAAVVDQVFNSCEKRLAQLLLRLADFGKLGEPERVIARITQETLAEMIGTTRPRVSVLMNKFRQLGFIEYRGWIKVRGSLSTVVEPGAFAASRPTAA